MNRAAVLDTLPVPEARRTKTQEERCSLRGEPDDPVTMLLKMPKGPVYPLKELFGPKRRIQVGAHRGSHFCIDRDEYVSSSHCILHYEKRRLFVKCCGAKNRTIVNMLPLRPRASPQELLPGSLLVLGETEFLVCGQAGALQDVYIVPPLLHWIRRAVYVFGSARYAAERLHVPWATFWRWLTHGR